MTEPPAPLRRLDERWVPRAADAVARVRARIRRGGSAPAAVIARRAISDEPALAGSIAAVLVAGVLLATVGESGPRGDNAPQPSPPNPVAVVATVGPTPGASVATYLTHAGFDLRHFGEIAEGRSTFAVVDLDRYETPAQVQSSLADIEVVRAYVKVRAGRLPTLVRSVPVSNVSALDTGMRTAGLVAKTTAKSYAVLLGGLHPRTAADRAVKKRYAQQRVASLREATALAHPGSCACVFAVIVRGTYVQLAALSRAPGVRAVDPAPPQVEISGLTALPLLPDVTRTVPRTGLPGG